MKQSDSLYGIVTINDNLNYGNRLQNYALCCLLNRYGDSTTISLLRNMEKTSVNRIKQQFFPVRRFLGNLKGRLFEFLLRTRILRRAGLDTIRFYQNKHFTDEFISDDLFWISCCSGLKTTSHRSIKMCVIGSDQVWNYRWLSEGDLALRLGSFVPDDTPIISYAASFGVSEIPDEVKPIFQRYLPRLKAISVREDRGAELVKEMTGLDATVVLDPTLMLDMNQWNSITQGFVSDNDQYVLTYFLGNPSDEQEQAIQDYAKAHGCRVRRILDLRDKETYVAGPQDFVELFSKAQYVFTDSYHACCFSILYHKQFTVFNRAGMEGKANMNSRMETLFRLFDLDSVVMDKGLAPRIDYDKVDKLLARHRAESQAWLDKAMEA